MRISDWSSDVCSSDLPIFSQRDLKDAVPSERLHYGENDDKRGQYARHLIQHPQFLVAERPKPLCQLFRIANHPSMITAANDHKKEFLVKPALRPAVVIACERSEELRGGTSCI